jgi:hypothetical protein
MLLNAASPPRFSIEHGTARSTLNATLAGGFSKAGTFPKQRRQIRIDDRRAADAGQIGWHLQAGKDGVGNFCPRHGFFAVTVGHVARPEAHVFDAAAVFRSQENNGMSALAAADALRPKDFHEIARPRLSETVEIAAETELMKKARRAWSVRVPSAPNAFAIALISNDQLIERGEVELKLVTLAQGLEGPNKDKVGRTGTEAGVRRFWNNKEFPRFKMGSGLQSNFGEMGNGVFAAARDFFDLFEDKTVEIGRDGFAA